MLAHCWEDGDDHSKGSTWDVACGTLEQADGVFEVQCHEFVADTLDGGFADFLPSIGDKKIERWPHHRGKGEKVPLYGSSPDRPQIEPKQTDKLHAHCKCGGVEFWIARPSERSERAFGSWPDVLIPYHSNQPRPDRSAWWLRDNGTKFLGGVCSCNSCRLDTGMEWIQWAFVPTVDISLDTEENKPFSLDFGTMQHYRSSDGIIRHFCGVCGASVFYSADSRENLVDVAVGVLDAPEGARAESWLEWTTQRLSYREDALPRAENLTLAIEKGLKEFEKHHQK